MNALPYNDTKPTGSADFYFAINATFRWVRGRFGEAGWRAWLRELGSDYFRPVNEVWKSGGLPAVALYWRDFFYAESGSDVEVREGSDLVVIEVRICPAIAHLRANGRQISEGYCRHCAILGRARAAAAGLSMNLEGGGGSCVHRYAAIEVLSQDWGAIKEAAPC